MTASVIKNLGPLRCGHAVLAVVVICAAPFADGSVHLHDWRIFPSVIAPSLMMMMLFGLLLDLTMSRVFMTDAAEPELRRLRFVIKFDLVLLAVMLVAWLPFMTKVLNIPLLG